MLLGEFISIVFQGFLMNFKLSFRKILFLFLFSLIALFASRINFSQVVGSNSQYFNFFQFFGPVAGSFLGPVVGIASVFLAELIDFFVSGKAIEPINVLRLLPMLFAAFYFAVFAKKKSFRDASIVIPIICIVLFNLHPVARQAWYYALFWTIPVIAILVRKNLFLRSLGATFTAHAIGTIIWVWTVPMTAAQWTMLIPVTAMERVLFALGISVSFIAFNNLLAFIEAKVKTGVLSIEKNYVLKSTPGFQ